MADQRILIIEDHIIHMTFLMEQLTGQMGIPEQKITSCFDGFNAIKEIEFNISAHEADATNSLFSLIITDYCLPNASGITIL
jgi:CheY-like chemotaxis protein